MKLAITLGQVVFPSDNHHQNSSCHLCYIHIQKVNRSIFSLLKSTKIRTTDNFEIFHWHLIHILSAMRQHN